MKTTVKNSNLTILATAALAAAALTTNPAHAATLTWDHNADGTASDGSGTWLGTNQWLDGITPDTWDNGPPTPDNAIIGAGGTGGTITLGAISAGTVSINNFSGTYTLSGTSLDQTGGITVGSTAGTVTINSVISGAGGLTKTSTGRLTLSNAANSYSGQLRIENGELYREGAVNNNNANGVFGNSALPVILGASGQTGRLSVFLDGATSTNKDFTLATGGTGEIRFGNFSNVNFNITNADRPLTFTGTIGGGGNLVKLGGAPVILSGSNNYSGTTTVNEGPLRLGSANAIPGGIAATGGTRALTINGNGTSNVGAAIELTAASGNFLRGLGTGVDQFQIPGGVSGFSANGSARQVIVNNDPAFELQWGIATFNPSEFLLGYHPVTATGALTLQNRIDLNGATRTVRVNSNTATLSNEIRTSSGTAGLIKNGAGTLVLSGANTYNGPTQINEGTLTISNAATFTNTSAINLALGARLEVSAANAGLTKLVTGGGVPSGRFLRYSSAQTAAGPANGPGTILGTVELNLTNVNPDYTLNFGSGSTFQNLVTATYTSPIALSGDASLLSNNAVFTLNSGGITASTAGTKTLALTGSNTGANTVNSVIGNGSGTIALAKTGSGSWTLAGANTYSGATTASAGTLTLSGADGSIGSSAVTVAGGTLTVSNTGAANNGNRLSNSLAFTMNGGTFNFNNSAGAFDFSESAGTLTLIGGANTVAIQQAAVGKSSTLTFAGLSRTTGVINFTGSGLGTAVDPRSKITFTSAPTLTDGIIGPWATINGADYATLIGNDVVAYGGPMTDLTRQSSGDKAVPDSATANVRIIEGTGGSPANLTLAATTTTIKTLLNSTSGGTGTTTIDIASGQTLRVNSINSVPAAGALTLGTAADTGTLTPATAGGNLLLINSSTAIANNMTVNSVVANNTSASTVTKDGAGVLRLTGTNTYSGGTVINAGTLVVKADANLGAAGTGITFNGSGALSFGNHPATTSATIDLGTRPIAINNGAIAGLYHNWANGTTTISGAITGVGGMIWGRDPVLTFGGGDGYQRILLLSSSNTFTGPLTVGVGNENIGASSYFRFNSLGNSANPITLNRSAIPLEYNSGATADLTLDRPIVLGNSGTLSNLSSFALTYNGPLLTSGTGARTLTLDAGTGASTFGGVIADGSGQQVSVTKSGSGTWRLGGNNTYSGQTTINDGQGTLIFLNASQSVSASSKLWIGGSAGMTLLDDDSGTIHLGNNVDVGVAGTGERDGPTIFVGNNNTANGGTSSGTTTGSTIALGTFDLTFGDARSSQILRIRGVDGYRLQLGGLTLAKRADHSNPQIEPTTAPVTIAGPVIQASGKLATDSTNSDTLDLTGTATGNLISGVIRNAADYPGNPNARPLNIRKSGTGEWIFTGNNTYTGTTTVSAGTLRLVGGSQTSAITVNSGATLGFTLGSPTTSTASVTLNAGHKIAVTGTPNGTSDYLLMTASSFTGTSPVLDPAVPGYSLEVQSAGTQLVLVADPPTTTLVIDLGAATMIEGGAFGTFGATNLPLPVLPAGSILRSVSVDAAITATDNENYASDLAILFDPTPGTPGGDFTLRMTSGTITFDATNQLAWSGGASGPPTPLVNTKNAADWSAVGTIDLATYGIFLGNAYQKPGWTSPQGGTWSGTITLTYDLVGTGSPFDTWAATGTLGPVTFGGDTNGDGVQDGMAFLLGAANPDDDANGRLPSVSEDGSGNMVMQFNCLPSSARGTAQLRVAHSNTLASWTATVDQVPDANDAVPDNNVTFVVGAGPVGPPALNSVSATIDSAAAAGGKLFGRLRATE